MKEKVLEAFAELGFELSSKGDFSLGFDYEDIHMLYLPQAEDESFMNISIPGIYDLEEENPMVFIDLMNRINTNLKYVKAYGYGDSLWLFYERELFDDEDLPKVIISRMILRLECALDFSRNELAEIKAGEDGTDEIDSE